MSPRHRDHARGSILHTSGSASPSYEALRRPLKVGVHLDIIAALGDAIEPCATLTANV
jgi:hypothetical protein